jgi:hypothetical protein
VDGRFDDNAWDVLVLAQQGMVFAIRLAHQQDAALIAEPCSSRSDPGRRLLELACQLPAYSRMM